MGCPARCELNTTLVFTALPHDPTTGRRTIADSAPTYRIYENETVTPITTGTMDLYGLYDYEETLTIESSYGYEPEKTYTIFIQITVNTYTAGLCYAFKVFRKASNDILTGNVIVTEMIAENVIATETINENIIATESIAEDVEV